MMSKATAATAPPIIAPFGVPLLEATAAPLEADSVSGEGRGGGRGRTWFGRRVSRWSYRMLMRWDLRLPGLGRWRLELGRLGSSFLLG